MRRSSHHCHSDRVTLLVDNNGNGVIAGREESGRNNIGSKNVHENIAANLKPIIPVQRRMHFDDAMLLHYFVKQTKCDYVTSFIASMPESSHSRPWS